MLCGLSNGTDSVYFIITPIVRIFFVEIQSFILCSGIGASGPDGMVNGHWLGIHSVFPTQSGYPFEFTLPYFMLLRRNHRNYDEQFSLRFDLVNEDGQPVGLPKEFRHEGVFPSGKRFYQFHGSIKFIVPKPGDYRLDITADEEGNPFVYAYNIESTEKSE